MQKAKVRITLIMVMPLLAFKYSYYNHNIYDMNQ